MYFIQIVDTDGRKYNLNLAYVVSVSLPGGTFLNEKILLADGENFSVVAGTWETAIASMFAAFNENPQPPQNVKDKVFIDLS